MRDQGLGARTRRRGLPKDQGSQYTSEKFQRLMADNDITFEREAGVA